MTRYLQQLVARMSGERSMAPIAPSLASRYGAGLGGADDPFEQTASAAAWAPAPPTTTRTAGQETVRALATGPDAPAEVTGPPAARHLPVPDAGARERTGLVRLAGSPPRSSGPVARTETAPGGWAPTGVAHPVRATRPDGPAPEERTGVALRPRPRAYRPVGLAPALRAEALLVDPAERGVAPQPLADRLAPLLSPVYPTQPPETVERQAPQELRPPEPLVRPALAREPEPQRLIIDRLSVEVVTAPPARPELPLARPGQKAASLPSRSEGPRSKLRFGLGQM
jgi:hypothetical protein